MELKVLCFPVPLALPSSHSGAVEIGLLGSGQSNLASSAQLNCICNLGPWPCDPAASTCGGTWGRGRTWGRVWWGPWFSCSSDLSLQLTSYWGTAVFGPWWSVPGLSSPEVFNPRVGALTLCSWLPCVSNISVKKKPPSLPLVSFSLRLCLELA